MEKIIIIIRDTAADWRIVLSFSRI